MLSFKKPTRMDIQEVDMVYSSFLSECIKRGIVTKDMLIKSYGDFGGYLSKDEVKDYSDTYDKFLNKQKELQSIDEGSDDAQKVVKEIVRLHNKIQEFEMREQDLFSKTAEVIARNKTILWLVFNFIYQKDGDTLVPVFAGSTDEEKYEAYEALEEEDPKRLEEIVARASLYVSFWFTGRASSTEEFKELDTLLNDNGKDPESTDEDSGGEPEDKVADEEGSS